MIPHFTYPWALLLLAFVPIFAWRYRQKTSGAWRYSDTRILPSIVSNRARWAYGGGLALRLLTLVLAILALSGPRWTNEERIPTEGISIAMILDVSQSMSKEDFPWEGGDISRLLGVKKLFRLFVAGGTGPEGVELKGRGTDLIALITFATHPETACPLTLDHSALLKIADAQQARGVADEGTTNPGDAIAWALHVMTQAPTKRKVLVYLTDGEANVSQKLLQLQAAQLAANLAIPIYAIDASPESDKPEEIEEARRTKEKMQAVARMTEGHYFRAQDGKGLLQAYESIDRLERERIMSFQYRRFYEGFHWFALTALACCLVLVVLEATVWRKIP